MDFLVKRDDLRECRFEAAPVPEPAAGEAVLEIESFSLTSNNVTYAVMGDAMSYWRFFPAEEGWGRVPVWGFANVAASAHEELEEGTRLYGYFPPSSHLLVVPQDVGERGFREGSPHRAELPARSTTPTSAQGTSRAPRRIARRCSARCSAPPS